MASTESQLLQLHSRQRAKVGNHCVADVKIVQSRSFQRREISRRCPFDADSARAFLVYDAELRQRRVAIEDIITKIAVVNRGPWGELRFGSWD